MNRTPGQERLLIGILTAINFTQLVDFVVMMPLGPQLMKVFAIDATRFSVAVSAYTFSAAIASVAAAAVIDRFERKRALLVLYLGFALATAGCALAPDFHALVLARIAAGAFGGLLGALILAIVADAIPFARRGAAMGLVMSAFAIASVVGVPAGVWLAAWLGWHAAFYAIAIISGMILVVATAALPTMRGHLDGERRSPWATIRDLVAVPAHWNVFAFTTAMVFAGFLVIPFIAAYLSRNLGVGDRSLALVYLCGGMLSFATSPLIGRWSDRRGKHRVFLVVALLSTIPTLALTNLPPMPLAGILAVTTAFVVLGSGRFVPAMALISSAVEPSLRGSFMSLNSAVQSAATGAAAITAGLIIHQDGAEAPLEHYDVVGWLACAVILVGVALSRTIVIHPDALAPRPPAAGGSPAALGDDRTG